MKRVEKEVDIECSKCGSKGRAKANNYADSIHACKCGNIVTVRKLSGLESREE
jgi:hypothetical protein